MNALICRIHDVSGCRECMDKQCPEHSGPVRCILFAGHDPKPFTHNFGGLSPDSVWQSGFLGERPAEEPCGGPNGSRVDPADGTRYCWVGMRGGIGIVECGSLVCEKTVRCGKVSERDGHPFCWLTPFKAQFCMTGDCPLTPKEAG